MGTFVPNAWSPRERPGVRLVEIARSPTVIGDLGLSGQRRSFDAEGHNETGQLHMMTTPKWREAAVHTRRLAALLQLEESRAVSAHLLMNSACVVSMGIETLRDDWERIGGADRGHLLDRMLVHSLAVQDSLTRTTQGRNETEVDG